MSDIVEYYRIKQKEIHKDCVPKADLRKLVEDLKDTPQEGDFKEYVLYRLGKLLGGE